MSSQYTYKILSYHEWKAPGLINARLQRIGDDVRFFENVGREVLHLAGRDEPVHPNQIIAHDGDSPHADLAEVHPIPHVAEGPSVPASRVDEEAEDADAGADSEAEHQSED